MLVTKGDGNTSVRHIRVDGMAGRGGGHYVACARVPSVFAGYLETVRDLECFTACGGTRLLEIIQVRAFVEVWVRVR